MVDGTGAVEVAGLAQRRPPKGGQRNPSRQAEFQIVQQGAVACEADYRLHGLAAPHLEGLASQFEGDEDAVDLVA